MATRGAFAILGREPATSKRLELLETAAYALLANTLIDACLAVIGALGAFVISRSAF